jgi:hypothetical protein
VAEAGTAWTILREGKRECVWVDAVQVRHAPKGVEVQQADQTADAAREANEVTPVQTLQARRVYRLTERTIDILGQQMLLAEYVLEGLSTTLPATQAFGAQQIIDLYADHATHEQFHTEFKTDMDLVRLPSGKFDTNLPGVRTGGGGDEFAAADRSAHAAWAGLSHAPPSPAQAHPHGDARADVQGRTHGQTRPPLGSWAWGRTMGRLQRSSGTGKSWITQAPPEGGPRR